MASYTHIATQQPASGLQPFDPRRHMIPVANLVSEIFADELDARGRNALREMRWIGRVSSVLGSMLTMALFNEEFSGQVWIEDGHVVGNVTLQPADASGFRWRISNVAVAQAYRGRGIARGLMQAALSEIAQRGGQWAVLQVYARNQTAHHLYRALRFEDVFRVGVWRMSQGPRHAATLDPEPRLEPLRAWHGREWQELAKAARSHLAQWAEPIRAEDYQVSLGQHLGEALGRVTGVQRVARWGFRVEGRLMAAVETRAALYADHDTLRFIVHPEARGKLEGPLLARGLASLARPTAPSVVVEHDGEHLEGVAALQEAGFRIQRDLITMRRAISPADART